jgi:hypothetical protein
MTVTGVFSEGWYRHICYPTSHLPSNCGWVDVTKDTALTIALCIGSCGSNQFQLNTDTYTDANRSEMYLIGKRPLCCDSTQLISECKWTACQHSGLDKPKCPDGTQYMTFRSDNNDGSFCDDADANPYRIPQHKRAFCCPKDETLDHCKFSNSPRSGSRTPALCPKTQVQYTSAFDLNLLNLSNPPSTPWYQECIGYPVTSRQTPEYPYCCEPPSYNEKWAVPPKYLWAHPYDHKGDDVSWSYADTYVNNDADTGPCEGDGYDAYGFVMLDGPGISEQ